MARTLEQVMPDAVAHICREAICYQAGDQERDYQPDDQTSHENLGIRCGFAHR